MESAERTSFDASGISPTGCMIGGRSLAASLAVMCDSFRKEIGDKGLHAPCINSDAFPIESADRLENAPMARDFVRFSFLQLKVSFHKVFKMGRAKNVVFPFLRLCWRLC